MRQLIYRSQTTAQSALAADDIPSIVQDASARNGIGGITGLLYAEDNYFLQVIEGPGDAIEDLLDRLMADPRHNHVRILIDRDVDAREFGDWTMIFRERRERGDDFDDRMRVLLAGVSPPTARHFRALQPA